MKALKLILILLVTSFTINAQTPKLAIALKKGISILDSAKVSEQYLQAATYFESVGSTAQAEWLPQYYVAYSYLMAGINSKGTNESKDEIYDKAMHYTNKADALSPENSEVYVLKGYITFMKMSVESHARAVQMIPEADDYLIKSTTLNPENPRAYLVRGQCAYFTPQIFGGGKDVAKPLLTTGVEKYAKQNVNDAAPNWGKNRCIFLLKQYN